MNLKYIIISSGLIFTMILTGIGLNCLEKPNQENYMQEVSNENIICDGQTKNVELVENSEIINDSIIDENNILQEKIDNENDREEIKIITISEPKKEEIVTPKQTIKKTQDKNLENLSSEKEESIITTTIPKDTQKQEMPKQKQEQTKIETIEQENETPKCSGNNHKVETGNSGKWFNNESEAVAYYNSIIKIWGDKWENFEIDDESYHKNCPYGYEDWSCPYCGKWTINFYYN